MYDAFVGSSGWGDCKAIHPKSRINQSQGGLFGGTKLLGADVCVCVCAFVCMCVHVLASGSAATQVQIGSASLEVPDSSMPILSDMPDSDAPMRGIGVAVEPDLRKPKKTKMALASSQENYGTGNTSIINTEPNVLAYLH